MQMAQEQPYWPANGRTDMFWDQVNRQRAETVEDGADYPRLTLFQRGVLLLQR